MKNYSRQREAILRVLKNSKSHPTAMQVYNEVKKEIPNISLGTVYRNLATLNAHGDIISIAVGDGNEHYDGDISPHIHLRCRCCGGIEDLVLASDPASVLAKESGFDSETSVYIVYGRCKQCREATV